MLISATLLFLGIPLWMLFGAIGLIIWNRKHVKKQTGMFVIKTRLESEHGKKKAKWSKKGYAQWVHDVLIIRSGMGLMKSTPYGVKKVESNPKIGSPHEIKGLGEKPILITVRLDDDSRLHIALDKKHPELSPKELI